ncbi:Uncharacterized protein Rs2_04114 [Raphanus sativus]|nr:Uncharacterized protein Rs2_04114 [Raphanus sativus]
MEPSVNVNGSMLRNETNNAVVYYHLNKLLASQFEKPPQEIAEASRANANAKAYAAAKAVAAAKAALKLIASFPNQEELACGDASSGMIVAISSPSRNEEWSGGRLRERGNAEVGSSSRVVESSVSGGQGGEKEDVQKPTKKRGRPKKH